jgi:hypothetical protein
MGLPTAARTERVPTDDCGSNGIARAELVGTIVGSVLALPVLAGLGYGAWWLVRLVA